MGCGEPKSRHLIGLQSMQVLKGSDNQFQSFFFRIAKFGSKSQIGLQSVHVLKGSISMFFVPIVKYIVYSVRYIWPNIENVLSTFIGLQSTERFRESAIFFFIAKCPKTVQNVFGQTAKCICQTWTWSQSAQVSEGSDTQHTTMSEKDFNSSSKSPDKRRQRISAILKHPGHSLVTLSNYLDEKILQCMRTKVTFLNPVLVQGSRLKMLENSWKSPSETI